MKRSIQCALAVVLASGVSLTAGCGGSNGPDADVPIADTPARIPAAPDPDSDLGSEGNGEASIGTSSNTGSNPSSTESGGAVGVSAGGNAPGGIAKPDSTSPGTPNATGNTSTASDNGQSNDAASHADTGHTKPTASPSSGAAAGSTAAAGTPSTGSSAPAENGGTPPATIPPGDYPVVVDLAGLEVGKRVSLFLNHDNLTVVKDTGKFELPTPVRGGTRYHVSVAVHPVGQRCDVKNGAGTAGDRNAPPVSISCQRRWQIGVSRSRVKKEIRSYAVNPEVGKIMPLQGMKITTEGYPHRMMLHPNGKTGYVIGTDNSGGESTISSPSTLGGRYFMKFSIDESTGRLLQLPAPRLTMDHHATEMAFGARGRRFFVVGNHYDNLKQDYIEEYLALNSAGEISVFRTYVIDRSPDSIPTDKCARMRNRVGSGGDLRDVPDDLRLTPNGKFAYMVDCAPEMDRDLRLVAFAIDPMSGEFKRFDLTDPGVRGLLDVRIALSPQGTYLYASDTEGVKLHAFRVNRETGQLQALPGSPFPTAPKPGRVIVSPDGRFVYVVHPDAKLISAYSVAKMTGMLMPVQGSPFRQNGSPLDMTIDAAQSFAYTPLRDQMGIDIFKIDDETGALRMFERGATQNTYVEEFALTP